MISSLYICQARRISQAAFEKLKIIPQESLVWRANEDDPRKHDESMEGLFYELPNQGECKNIFGYPEPFDRIRTTFHNTIGTAQIMIRKPALTAMDYIKKLQPDLPNVRLLLYGDPGNGKTHTLVHLSHFLHMRQTHFIIQPRKMKKFTLKLRDYNESSSRPGRIDTPLSAALLLQHFKIQNAHLLEAHKETLVCSKDYKWSLREEAKAGSPLVGVADHGINRVTHASDCAAVLIKELMLAADAGKIRLAAILDNVQYLFREFTGSEKHPDLKKVLINEITVSRALKKLIKGSHKGGIVLAACDEKFMPKQNQTPGDVLGKEGWQHFDPFLPIHVPRYSRKEFESCMNFYQDIGWLCRRESKSHEVREEVRFTSAMSPREVEWLCRAL